MKTPTSRSSDATADIADRDMAEVAVLYPIDIHPMFVPNGYTIATRPIEFFASICLRNIEQDHHGVNFDGLGRIGKTGFARYLTEHPGWLSVPGVILRITLLRSKAQGDSAFFGMLLRALRIRFPDRLTGPRRLERLVNYLVERCEARRVSLIVLFIDEANRLLISDFEHLVDLDNELDDRNLRLFIVFIRQIDVDGGVAPNLHSSNFASHIVGRFLMETHRFRGILGVEEIAHALSRFDDATEWPPRSGTSYSAYFAPVAFARGWRLAQHAEAIEQIVRTIRQTAGLSTTADWPMKTFSGFVKFLLCDIAKRRSDFVEFTENDFRLALEACGFLQLEYVRAGLVAETEDS